MYNDREILLNRFKMEIDCIMRSLDPEAGCDRECVVDALLKLYKRKGTPLKDNPGAVSSSSYYILAQILQTTSVDSYKAFMAELGRRLPVYTKNPKYVMRLGGLPWKFPFEVPAARARGQRRVAKEGTIIPSEWLSVAETQMAELGARLDRLAEKFNDLHTQLNELRANQKGMLKIQL